MDNGEGTRQAGRPRDPAISKAITVAALRLLEERGFARMSMEAVAAEAGVGKPAIYRRFRTKADVVAAAIAEQLPNLEAPDLGDTRTEVWAIMTTGLPPEGEPYLALIGGLLAEYRRHPELVRTFRDTILLRRRTVGLEVVRRGQRRGDLDPDLDPEMAIDLLIGPFYSRVIAGLDAGTEWRRAAVELWWSSVGTERR